MKSSEVMCLERRLQELGLQDSYIDGEFGTITENAVVVAIIGANSEPNVSGDAPGEIPHAPAIFLHRHSYSSNGAAKPSAGCVSLASGELRYVLGRVNTSVLFAIGTSMHLYHDA